MVIIGIRKRTKAGAYMYDTINSNEFKYYRVKGWGKTPIKTNAGKFKEIWNFGAKTKIEAIDIAEGIRLNGKMARIIPATAWLKSRGYKYKVLEGQKRVSKYG